MWWSRSLELSEAHAGFVPSCNAMGLVDREFSQQASRQGLAWGIIDAILVSTLPISSDV